MKAAYIAHGFATIFSTSPAAQAQYIGSDRCRACRLPEAKSWGQTKMAGVFELLKPGVAGEAKRAKKRDLVKHRHSPPKYQH